MSLRLGCVGLAVIALASCGSPQTTSNDPKTAKEKQLREARASGDIDKPNQKWGGWRYQGDRKECFYVVGRKCFKTEKTACASACKSMSECKTVGGGPATVSCKKK